LLSRITGVYSRARYALQCIDATSMIMVSMGQKDGFDLMRIKAQLTNIDVD
jgi:hypothetical protein